MKNKCKKCKHKTSSCDYAPCGKMEAKVPRRIWHGISANGKLTHSYLLTKKEVDYYAKKNGMEFVEYIRKGIVNKVIDRTNASR